MQDGALDDALETERRLGIDLVAARHLGRVLLDELAELLAHIHDLRAAGTQHLDGGGVIQHRQQQVLHRDEFMALLSGIHECHVQRDFKFLGDHLVFLHRTLQRMLVLPREIHNLLDLGVCDIFRKHPANPDALSMHFEHDLCSPFSVDGKKLLQDVDHKFHRRVIVIQQQHLEQRRRLDP